MKASEIRVGNWATNSIGEEYQITPATILHLSVDSATVNPIPLTEEWLLKFGFKHGATSKHRFIVFRIGATSESYIYCNDVKDGLDIGICIDEFDETGLSTPVGHVKYVHQLQNLYQALTGEELTLSK